jgi:hypothetical protein
VTRKQLEHLIRAAAEIADDTDIVVLGSQAVLGQFPDAPEALRISMEADLFPLHHPERSEVIDGSIGELSPFHETFGYYAHGISEETARLPQGWKERLVAVRNENTRGATGLCLEIHDLLAAKAVALRDKDLAFLREAARHRLADQEILLQRLATVEVEAELRQAARAAVLRAFQEAAD